MEQVAAVKQKLTRLVLIFLILPSALLLALGQYGAALGLAFGALMGTLNFYLLASTLTRAVQLPPVKAKAYAVFHYILRYALLFAALFVALRRPDMVFVWALAGLFLPKIAAYLIGIFPERKGDARSAGR